MLAQYAIHVLEVAATAHRDRAQCEAIPEEFHQVDVFAERGETADERDPTSIRESVCGLRERPGAELAAPFGTVVQLIREAFTEGSVSAATYDAAVSLLGVRQLIDLVSLAGMYASTAALLSRFDMQLDAGETHLLPSAE